MNDNVKVVVRCRPLNQKEKMMGNKQAVIVDEIRGTVTVNKLDASQEPPKMFTFDTVFGPDSKQLDVYNLTARPIIDSVLEGYNGKNDFFSLINNLSVINFVLLTLLTLDVLCKFVARHNFCIWADWNGQNIHNGGCESGARTQRDYPKLLCPHIWSHCQSRR